MISRGKIFIPKFQGIQGGFQGEVEFKGLSGALRVSKVSGHHNNENREVYGFLEKLILSIKRKILPLENHQT